LFKVNNEDFILFDFFGCVIIVSNCKDTRKNGHDRTNQGSYRLNIRSNHAISS